MKFLRIFLIIILTVYFYSCEKDRFITDGSARLEFSVDTLYFDTVFTTLGTVTRRFTVRNIYKDFIRISSVSLAKGMSSAFRVNLDGIPGVKFTNIEIPPLDSIYVFVDATLDPNNSNGILLQQDSVVFTLNGIPQDVDLMAWGQDVHILRDSLLKTQTWTNEKPYLILDAAGIDTLNILTIETGTKIYFHRNAAFYIFGSLRVQGSKDAPVIFQGDRLEKLYEDIPGQWTGLIFYPGSKDNEINHAEIKGAIAGIVLTTQPYQNNPVNLSISNTTVKHMSAFGIHAADAVINGYNNIFANCGISALALELGGSYEFYHCTVSNKLIYGNLRNTPSIYLNNYFTYNDKNNQEMAIINGLEKAYFGNCIIYGNTQNELIVERYKGSGILNYMFDHCLIRFDSIAFNLKDPQHFLNVYNRREPGFIFQDKYNFHLDSTAFAIDKGDPAIGINYPSDYDGVSRIADGKPDIGAYEFVSE